MGWVREWLLGKLLDWAWVKYAPIVLPALYAVAGIVTGQHAPLIVLGVAASFCFGLCALAASEYFRYIRVARTKLTDGHSVPPLAIPITQIIGRRKQPLLSAVHHNGVKAVVDVTNSGGDAVVWGDCKIIGAYPGFQRHAPYVGLWWDSVNDRVHTGKVFLGAGATARLLLASHEIGDFPPSVVRIRGDKFTVDAIATRDPKHGGAMQVKVSITVTFRTDPPAVRPLYEEYVVSTNKDSLVLTVRPLAPDASDDDPDQ